MIYYTKLLKKFKLKPTLFVSYKCLLEQIEMLGLTKPSGSPLF